ncbi:ribonuclease H-like protein [Atractiella rhizophila]|nr:ribonuclease H-like protein [Atractiella rhizophila]
MPSTDPSTNLVWVDLEMTGLDLTKDRVLEIAVIVTDKDLNPLDDGLTFVIQTDKSVLDGMGEWCTKQHGQSGLTEACLKSSDRMEEVELRVLRYIERHIPRRGTAILAGNTVHADKAFLKKDMPRVHDHLHYRIVDVSSIKELCKRWYPDLEVIKSQGKDDHRALTDILHSIAELKFYRSTIFKEVPSELK